MWINFQRSVSNLPNLLDLIKINKVYKHNLLVYKHKHVNFSKEKYIFGHWFIWNVLIKKIYLLYLFT